MATKQGYSRAEALAARRPAAKARRAGRGPRAWGGARWASKRSAKAVKAAAALVEWLAKR
ncbi:MAG: hypothetical protein CMN31_21725 [Sandaracinus sp.]|nr:hypothetical protein [Sandaracinus sp.]MBJ73910.1 hypothetical protein [Sandaracinus sp.]